MTSQHEFLSVNAGLFVLGMMLCLIASALIKHYQFVYLPECAAFILIGAGAGFVANFSSDAEQQFMTFSPHLVFFIMLPPIILDAGYRLKRKDFFASFGLTLVLATVGTIINNVVFGYLLFAAAQGGWLPLDKDSPLECLLFGAIISATDPVATLSLMGSKLVNTDPLLYSVIMGESVLNDAVAIVLYKAFESSITLDADGEVSSESFTAVSLVLSMLEFVAVSLGSVACGVTTGLTCCFLCKRVNLTRFPLSELTVVSLFAFLSYFLAEMIFLSGIMSLFFAAICLAHYNYYNLTPVAQIAAHESFSTMAQLAETALYAFIGLTLGLSIQSSVLKYDPSLSCLTIVICFVARAANVFPLCALSNVYQRWRVETFNRERESGAPAIENKTGIPAAMQIPLWFAGLRGGVSFALSLSFPGSRRPVVVGATLVLVIFSTFVCGGLTLPLLKLTGMTVSREIRQFQHSLASSDDSEAKSSEDAVPRENATSHSPPPSLIIAHFKRLDEKFLRRVFGTRTCTRDAAGNMMEHGHANAEATASDEAEDNIIRASQLAPHLDAISPGSVSEREISVSVPASLTPVFHSEVHPADNPFEFDVEAAEEISVKRSSPSKVENNSDSIDPEVALTLVPLPEESLSE